MPAILKNFLFLITLFNLALVGQEFAISGNGMFIAKFGEELNRPFTQSERIKFKKDEAKASKMYLQPIQIYGVKCGGMIFNDTLQSLRPKVYQSAAFNYDGTLLFVQGNGKSFVVSIPNGAVIKESYENTELCFAPSGTFFIERVQDEFFRIDVLSGKLRDQYTLDLPTKRSVASSFKTSPNEELFVYISGDQMGAVYKMGRKKALKKFAVNEINFSQDEDYMTLFKESTGAVSLFKYKVSDMSRTDKFIFKNIIKKQLDKRKLVFNRSRSSLSQYGNYFAYVYEEEQQKGVVFFDLSQGVFTFEYTSPDKDYPVWQWASDSTVLLNNKSILNLRTGQFEVDLNPYFNFGLTEAKLNVKKQKKYIQIAPNLKYSMLSYKNQSYFKSTLINQKHDRIKADRLIGFSGNSERVFVAHKDKIGYYDLSALEVQSQDSAINWFAESCNFIPTESPFGSSGVEFLRFKSKKSMADFEKDSVEVKVNIEVKEVYLSEGNPEVQFQMQIIDDQGNFLTGAGERAYLKNWCNVVIENEDGQIRQISDFQIEEVKPDPKVENALALGLDFSGSMGMERAYTLQDGVNTFIQTKRANDWITVLKFDHKVVLCSKPEQDKYFISKGLQNRATDYEMFKGGTSLLDALKYCTSYLQDQEVSGQKIVILFTDGNETTSFATKEQIIHRAQKNNIKIFTIGLGSFVSSDYLSEISESTGGKFYAIQSDKDLAWVFNDVYNKATNYYLLKMNIPQGGKQKLYVKLCPPKGEGDTATIQFERQLNLYVPEADSTPQQWVEKSDSTNVFADIQDIQDYSAVITHHAEQIDSVIIAQKAIQEAFDSLVLPHFNFYFDSDSVTNLKSQMKSLAKLVQFLKKNPLVNLEVHGHTDDQGEEEYNQKLSELRAEKARQLIIQYKIEGKRIKALGFGEDEPIVLDTTEEARAKNRRVEFHLVFPQKK